MWLYFSCLQSTIYAMGEGVEKMIKLGIWKSWGKWTAWRNETCFWLYKPYLASTKP